MPDARMDLLGIGEDPDQRNERESGWFEEKHRLDMKMMRAKHRTELWKERFDMLRTQFELWGVTAATRWQFAFGLLVTGFLGVIALWILSWFVMWAASIVATPFGPWVTGYAIQESTTHTGMYYITQDGNLYTPHLTADQAQIQLEQLRHKYPGEGKWAMVISERTEPCWEVVREAKLAKNIVMSPCYVDYGITLAVFQEFQIARVQDLPITLPQISLYDEPLEILDAPEVIEKIVEKPVIQWREMPHETTVLVVPESSSLWLPYADKTLDVPESFVDGMLPDNVYYVVPE